MNALEAYASQSTFSAPGRMSDWIADAPRDIAGIRDLTTQLVFHYRADGDPVERGFTRDRLAEIDLRYADDMLARLYELQPESINAPRAQTRRILGCCRDFTLLFVTLARAAGIPARSRVGFAGYFMAGWWVDHVVAEAWDATQARWRLVDPQLTDGFFDDGTKQPLNVLDVPRDRFLVGADAWRVAQAGRLGHDRFVVAPEIVKPFLRSWTYLAHNLVSDLAALNKREMILWECWGMIDTEDAPDAEHSERLDALAERIADQSIAVDGLAELYARDGLAVTDSVVNYSPIDGLARTVKLRPAAI